MLLNQPLMCYHQITRFMHLSTLIGHAGIYSKYSLKQRLPTGQGIENKRLQCSAANGYLYHIPLLPRLRGQEQGAERVWKPEIMNERIQGNSVFWTSRAPEHRNSVLLTRKVQTTPNPILEREVGHKVSALNEVLLATNGF